MKNKIELLPEEEKRAKHFISSVTWTFAKTYAQTAPHSYCVRNTVPHNLIKDFFWFVKLIKEKGFEKHFYTKKFTYLRINDKKYWTMDPTVESTDLINRDNINNEYKKENR